MHIEGSLEPELMFKLAERNGIGIAPVIARLIHPGGLVNGKGATFGRFYGTLITWLGIALLAILDVVTFALPML